MKRKPKNANSHPLMRRLETERTIILVGLSLVLAAAVLLSIHFYFYLGSSSDKAQALGNVVGGTAGAFGAYLVARWQFNAHIRGQREERAILASATFNAVRDRYDVFEQLVGLLEPLHAQGPNGMLVGLGGSAPNTIQFETIEVEPSIRAVISAQFPYESLTIYEMDLALKRTRLHLQECRRLMQPNGSQTSAKDELEQALECLRAAAEQWELVVEGCDLIAHLGGKPEALKGEAQAAALLIERIEALIA